jgi:8-oxo-dGTP pyrophosphatase MutT (NUDIX family)
MDTHTEKALLASDDVVSAMLQGGWEDDESIDEAACREAFEEAGVKGIISVGGLDLLLTWHALFH